MKALAYLVVIGFFVLPFLLTDRRLWFRVRRVVDHPEEELGRAARVLVVSAGSVEALSAARQAVETVSGRVAKTYSSRVVMAWQGSVLTNIPSSAQYQYVVAIVPGSGEGTRVVCAVRTRIRTNWLCFARAQKLTDELARTLAAGPSRQDGARDHGKARYTRAHYARVAVIVVLLAAAIALVATEGVR